ncbi:MAG: 50S ribosomal protein L18 [Chloroflexi bacterium]|nr:50S ribosomal protein L18 [Chloroflexota bacterium]MDA1296446.1 50S ribosomal protein L18 [Chloroflexota bacterium]
MASRRFEPGRRSIRHRRVRKRVAGTAARPRLSVFRSNKQIYVQLIDDLSGKTLAAASSVDAGTTGATGASDGKTAAAVAVGEAIAKKATESGIKQVVFDRAGYKYHGRVKALADGARSGGLDF